MPAGTIPLVTFEGITVNDPSLHIVDTMLVTAGVGLIVTVRVNDAPGQLPIDGVTV